MSDLPATGTDVPIDALKTTIKRLPLIGRWATDLHRRLRASPGPFPGSRTYWVHRYRAGGHSGEGSRGFLASYKADVLNKFVKEHAIRSVVELGCGDGAQLALAEYPSYVGYDISQEAVARCKKRFAQDPSKRFEHIGPDSGILTAQLALSLDVIYHLVEDPVFDEYMHLLFRAAERYVIIYSSNHHDSGCGPPWIRHRRFTDWVESHRPDFQLQTRIDNPFPYERLGPRGSFSDFFIFASGQSDTPARDWPRDGDSLLV